LARPTATDAPGGSYPPCGIVAEGDVFVAPSLDLETLRAVIVGVFPGLAGAAFTPQTRGWDSVAIDVDDRLLFKLPRHEAGRAGLVREAALLAIIRPAVTLPTPA
jgi:aminoglycoside phosphotransferase (APT) family kinase protein